MYVERKMTIPSFIVLIVIRQFGLLQWFCQHFLRNFTQYECLFTAKFLDRISNLNSPSKRWKMPFNTITARANGAMGHCTEIWIYLKTNWPALALVIAWYCCWGDISVCASCWCLWNISFSEAIITACISAGDNGCGATMEWLTLLTHTSAKKGGGWEEGGWVGASCYVIAPRHQRGFYMRRNNNTFSQIIRQWSQK